jgi:hypothetical protein
VRKNLKVCAADDLFTSKPGSLFVRAIDVEIGPLRVLQIDQSGRVVEDAL